MFSVYLIYYIIIRLIVISFSGYFLYHLVNRIKNTIVKINAINKLPGPKSFNLLMGNLPLDVLYYIGADFEESKDLYYQLLTALRGYTKIYSKEGIFRLWFGWEPLLVLWKPETVEVVLSNNFLLDKSSQYSLLHPWLGTGLLTSSGNKWRSRRKLLIPAFHFKILHDFVPVFNEQGQTLAKKLCDLANSGKPVDIVPLVTACTLDIICGIMKMPETIMGVSIGAQNNYNNSYCRTVTEVGECFVERMMQPSYWSDPLYYRLERGKQFKSKVKLLHDFTMKVIRDRKSEILGIKEDRNYDKSKYYIGTKGSDNEQRRKAFMDLLIDHHLNEGDINEEGIREEVDTFMFEGHDTTAMAMSWIIYLLGHHQSIQERLCVEIDSLFEEIELNANEDDQLIITLDKIKELKYLECVVKEGLRLCPSVPFIGREVHQDLQIKGYNIPQGTVVYCFIYQLHRDPTIFPNPEKFDPDRFLPENIKGRHPFAFVPFSAGPRNCIGQRFALSELKIVLALVLRHLRFQSIDQWDKILFNMEMVLRPKVPLRVRVFKRETRTPFSSLNIN